MKPLTIIIAVLAIVVLWVLAEAFFIVDMTEQAIITQFGRPVGEAITDAGLQLKTPFVQKVNFFEKRIL